MYGIPGMGSGGRRRGGSGCLSSIVFIILLFMLYRYVTAVPEGTYYEPGAYGDEAYDAYNDQGYGSGYGSGSYSYSSTGRDTSATDINNSLFSAEAIRDHKVTPKGNGEDSVTILVYMNGSTLETDAGEASKDLAEMIAAGSSDHVNVIVETLGTRKWQRYGIASNRSQIYKLDGGGLTLLKDDLGQLDCTVSTTLSDFIIYGANNYPADRYMLIFWNHGGGPVYGFGEDQYQGDYESLTIDEIQTALNTAGVYFDFIGMDCCIMSCMEVCCAMYDYADYAMLSEDFESGLGWYYTDWLKALVKDSSTSTPDLAKLAIDGTVSANEKSREGDNSILALIDLSYMKVLYTAWTDFAYANEDALTEKNYSQKVTKSGRQSALLDHRTGRAAAGAGVCGDCSAAGAAGAGSETAAGAGVCAYDRAAPEYGKIYGLDIDMNKSSVRGKASLFNNMFSYWNTASSTVSMSDYYITDIMAVAENIESDESAALSSALANTITYVNATSGDKSLTGLSVTLPYGDQNFYTELKTIFRNVGFDSNYVNWLEKFVSASGYSNFYDYGNWMNEWNGWSNYQDTYNWSLWDLLYGAASYWNDNSSMGWSDWDYSDSYNQWYDDNYPDSYGGGYGSGYGSGYGGGYGSGYGSGYGGYGGGYWGW